MYVLWIIMYIVYECSFNLKLVSQHTVEKGKLILANVRSTWLTYSVCYDAVNCDVRLGLSQFENNGRQATRHLNETPDIQWAGQCFIR